MPIPITGLYVGLTILLVFVLSIQIGPYRAKRNVSMGDGGDPEILVRMRRHGNLLETAALTLLAIGVVELNGGSSMLVHGLGLAYILARIAHPLGLKADNTNVGSPFRLIGALGSMLVMVITGCVAIWQYVQAMTAG